MPFDYVGNIPGRQLFASHAEQSANRSEIEGSAACDYGDRLNRTDFVRLSFRAAILAHPNCKRLKQ